MKSFSTILFGVFLTALVSPSTGLSMGDFFTSEYKEYCMRLQTWIEASPDNLLPFVFSQNVIKDLNHVSNEFVEYMIKADSELLSSFGVTAPVAALKKTIDVIFESIGNRTKSKNSNALLFKIKLVDPLGLDAFLKKVHKQTKGEFSMDDVVSQYYELMANRLILLQCKDNPSIIKDPQYNAAGKMNSVPEWIRKELATEDAVISEELINYFLDIAARQYSKTKFYHVKDGKVHDSSGNDGLRILFGARVGPDNVPNWLCVRYNAYNKKLYVYDNVLSFSHFAHSRKNMTQIQEHIINAQFPHKTGTIIYESPKTPLAEPASSGVYAMIYSITVLMGEEPNKIKFKLNYGYGDRTLYMRLHLLKVFANKRLAAMD